MSDTGRQSSLQSGSEHTSVAGESRREFLSDVTLAALGIAGLGSMAVAYQYFLPNVLFEPSPTFRAGNPDLFPPNSVTFIEDQQVYIVRTNDGFYAVSAVCTHLGCITAFKPDLNVIACPCHGSVFKTNGTKIEGPAPRPLPHFSISLEPTGELLVDKLQVIAPNQALKV
jgi:cytochrome b6-f complex iron-sulfur subunit